MKRLKLFLIPWLYKVVVSLIMLSCRVTFIGREVEEPLKQQGKTWIYTAWHENTATAVWAKRNDKVAMMASDSKDGEIIARGIRLFGNIPVRGSASRGGAKAVKAMVRLLKEGHLAAITPDGPRGPLRQLQSGVLYISLLAGSPIVPFHVVASREWVFPSWDRHRLPKPFSRVIGAVGAPYVVDRQRLKQDEAGVIAEVEELMQQNVERAEQALGNT
ncbi:MAG: lysophospholipid acyltransferase family protein [Pseudomonadota bacterium]